jgi:DNA-binding GntR family transcriptional regulator
MHGAIRPQVDRYRRIYISAVPTGGFSAEISEHEPILSALESGEPEAARAAVQANWSSAATRLGRIIAAVGDRGVW